MAFEVRLSADAVRDLEEIVEWVARQDAPAKADRVLGRIEAVIAGLAKFPARGAHPGELLAVGIREYRETFFKPYRIIYRVESKTVYVYLIADGRRDMQTLLARRLLAG
jgi:toxin ParE1/3/4